MSVQTQTLADFLLARIAEDEWTARIAPNARWPYNPARVLAECEAKAGVVGAYRGAVNKRDALIDSDACASLCTVAGAVAAALELALYSLALPYADHPDFREEWRP